MAEHPTPLKTSELVNYDDHCDGDGDADDGIVSGFRRQLCPCGRRIWVEAGEPRALKVRFKGRR